MTKQRKFLPAILITVGFACWGIANNAVAGTSAYRSNAQFSIRLGSSDRISAAGHFPALAADNAAKPIVLARLSEKNIPPESMPSGAGSPSPSPSPESTPAPHSGWQRLPENPSVTPSPAGNNASATGNGSAPATPQGQNPSPTANPSPNPGEGASAGENSEGNSTPPPAIDITTLTPAKDLSDAPLNTEIANADTPALAASLRLTEQARQELDHQHPDAAIRTLGHAISIDAGDPFAYFFLGRAYLAKSNYAQALTFFQRAEIGFGARPEWLSETISFEGACEEELGHLAKAVRDYQRALNASPNNLMARVGFDRLASSLPPANGVNNSSAPAGNGPPPPPSGSVAAPPPTEAPPPGAPVPASSDSAWKTLGDSPSQ